MMTPIPVAGDAGPWPTPSEGVVAAAGAATELAGRVAALEQELLGAQASIKELHLQLFNEKRDASQLRKEVASLRMGLDTANDMLDNTKTALGRSEAYSQVLQVSKEQLQVRLDKEQREHEDCRLRLEQLAEELRLARDKDPLLEGQLKVRHAYTPLILAPPSCLPRLLPPPPLPSSLHTACYPAPSPSLPHPLQGTSSVLWSGSSKLMDLQSKSSGTSTRTLWRLKRDSLVS